LEDKRKQVKHVPGNKRTEQERKLMIAMYNNEKYRSLPPSHIVPSLMFFKLYIIMDVYSRKIVGREVHKSELSEHAVPIRKTCLSEGICREGLILHSDNGGHMKGAAMLQRLDVIPSFSRPSVSDENSYSLALFMTLKYTYPNKPLESLDAYDFEHHHSALKFVTPA